MIVERCLDMMCIVYLAFIAIYQIPYHNICLQFVQMQIQLLLKKFLKYLVNHLFPMGNTIQRMIIYETWFLPQQFL